MQSFGDMLAQVRSCAPLIHNITNYVTVNDCANALLAAGASPIMADDLAEAEEITAACSGLVINIGTLNNRTLESMFLAGKRAQELAHPIVLDPVGAGASGFRTKSAAELVSRIHFDVIRGNISEIKTLADGSGSVRGVDVSAEDIVCAGNLNLTVGLAKSFAARTGSIIVITGAIDIVADAQHAYTISNGHPMMATITGSGCQLSSLIAAWLAANPNSMLDAAASAVIVMGLCGEIAALRMGASDGNASYRNYLIDALFKLTPEDVDKGAKYELC